MTTQCDKKTQRLYSTYRLVESYRNIEGKVRQRTLLNLGTSFHFPKEQWKLLADRIENICHGQKELFPLDPALEKEAQRIAKLIVHKYSVPEIYEKQSTANAKDKDLQTVDVNSLEHQNIRKVGCEHVGYHAANQLKISNVLKEVGFNQKQINVALGSIIGRLAQPGSELSTHRYLRERSALDELLGTDFSMLPLKNLYKISDLLLKNKSKIEKALYQQEKDLFNLEEVVTLYDITNTYFEGRCLSNPKAQYGRSKEKRNDCCLIALGIVLDASGFPKKSEFFPGNVSEPGTLGQMLQALNATEHATVVLDAGFATEENINWLKDSGRSCIVVSRKRNLVMPEHMETVILKADKNNQVHAARIKNEETGEWELYCHSKAKAEKTKEMVSKSSIRYEAELQKLAAGLSKKGCTKKYDKVMEKIGRLKEKYSRVGKCYKITVHADENNHHATAMTWKKKDDEISDKQRGIYCLRTNRQDLDEQTFWKIYTMLTELEAAFRSLKSELGMRPIYHQKTDRVDGHIFISIIAYHLLHTIRYQLKQQGIHDSWQTLRKLLDTQCRVTSTLQLQTGKTITIRKTSSPDVNQAIIYKALGIDSHPGKTEKIYF